MSEDPVPPLFSRLASASKRISGRVALGRGRVRDEEQLLSLVDQAVEQELLEDDDRAYIHSIVEFGDTLVREVMIPRTDMVTVSAEHTVREALETLLSSRHSRVPVVASGDSDDVEGVVYLRDASGFQLRRPEEAITSAVTRIMKPAVFVPELQRADELLRQMQRESNHLALVVDEYGGISGLVTLEDLIEELLGEINDEHDRETPEVEPQDDGTFKISARLPVDRLGEIFGIELEDEEVDSVGGLVAKYLGRLADEGDKVVVEGIELTALLTERKRQRLIEVGARWVGLDTAELAAQRERQQSEAGADDTFEHRDGAAESAVRTESAEESAIGIAVSYGALLPEHTESGHVSRDSSAAQLQEDVSSADAAQNKNGTHNE